jgi:hypothetical protein
MGFCFSRVKQAFDRAHITCSVNHEAYSGLLPEFYLSVERSSLKLLAYPLTAFCCTLCARPGLLLQSPEYASSARAISAVVPFVTQSGAAR